MTNYTSAIASRGQGFFSSRHPALAALLKPSRNQGLDQKPLEVCKDVSGVLGPSSKASTSWGELGLLWAGEGQRCPERI